VVSGEMLIELGVSWFSAKIIKVMHNHICIGGTALNYSS